MSRYVGPSPRKVIAVPKKPVCYPNVEKAEQSCDAEYRNERVLVYLVQRSINDFKQHCFYLFRVFFHGMLIFTGSYPLSYCLYILTFSSAATTPATVLLSCGANFATEDWVKSAISEILAMNAG